MHKTANITQTKQKNQNFIKIVLWVVTLLVLMLIIRQVASPRNTQLNNGRSATQNQNIEQHVEDLNVETQELDSSLDQLRFDEDIRALRDE